MGNFFVGSISSSSQLILTNTRARTYSRISSFVSAGSLIAWAELIIVLRMRKLSNLMGKTGTAGNAGTSSGGASADNSSAAVMEVKVNVTAIGENGATVNVNFGGFAANESNQWYLLIRPSKLFADALSKEKKNSDAMQVGVLICISQPIAYNFSSGGRVRTTTRKNATNDE